MKLKTAAPEVPEFVINTFEPTAPVATVPNDIVAAAPASPVSPLSPLFPLSPLAPIFVVPNFNPPDVVFDKAVPPK